MPPWRGRFWLRIGSTTSSGNEDRPRYEGTPIPTNDIWIAALVLEHNLALHVRDRHFDHLPQIVRA